MVHLPRIEIEPSGVADAAVIWLHGLGADGHDFEPIVAELKLPEEAAIRFVFPHAPSIPVTINGGVVMPAWYDIRDIRIDSRVDEGGVLNSAAMVTALVDREVARGIDSRRILVAGFSQGGAVAYQVALTYPEKLAGLLVLSGYLALPEAIVADPPNTDLPILVLHGTLDPVVPESLGRRSISRLRSLGYCPQYKTYPMVHGVCAEEIADIASWLRGRLCEGATDKAS